MTSIPNDTLAIFNQQGFAAGIEPQATGTKAWPPSGVSLHYLDAVTIQPRSKFGYGSGPSRTVIETAAVSFKFTWAEDPEVAAGVKASSLEWESDPCHILTQAQFNSLPDNQRKRVEIAYARLLGSLSAMTGTKVTMPEAGAVIQKIMASCSGENPLQVRVYVKNEPDKKNTKYQVQEAQIRELVSGTLVA